MLFKTICKTEMRKEGKKGNNFSGRKRMEMNFGTEDSNSARVFLYF